MNKHINPISDVHQTLLNVVVVGIGLPGQSVGWLHLTQLLNMDSVRVRFVIEPWWLNAERIETADGISFKEACNNLRLVEQGILLCKSVDELPDLPKNEIWLAVIACRTSDAPTMFNAVINKGVKNIYLEKPGAQSAAELRKMIKLAERSGAAVVVGYQKTVANYVEKAKETERAWKHDVVNLKFQHHNPYKPDELENIVKANKEGMLLNQCSHELALWTKNWGLKYQDIVDVIVDQEFTELNQFDEIQDYSKLSFTVTTTQGRNFKLVASRCGGIESSIAVQRGLVGENKVFFQADEKQQNEANLLFDKFADIAWYYPLFSPDYLRLKKIFIEHIMAGNSGVPDNVPTLADAASIFDMVSNIQPTLLAQTKEKQGNYDTLTRQKHEIVISNKDVVCHTPTVHRIWYAPDLFDSGCSTLVDVLRPPHGRLILCIDEKVWSIYRSEIEEWSNAQNIKLFPIVVPSGEQAKNIDVWLEILNDLWSVNPMRYVEPIIAIGGGAVTDTVGFVASVWRRATPWVRIPTTLLGMVDVSVGIKVSVNFLQKNGIGGFHSPRHTFIDPNFLRTNTERQLKAGIGEMLKAGLIYDKRIYSLLRSEGSRLIQQKFSMTNECNYNPAKESIFLSIKAMIECIGSDLYEENLSRSMDFGHTFSRWIERHEIFNLMHGEAVNIDCILSCLIAEQKGWLTAEEIEDILNTYMDMGLNIHVDGIDLDVYKEAIKQISVHRAGSLRAPLPGPIGNCRWTQEITKDELIGAWDRLHYFLECYPEGVLNPHRLKYANNNYGKVNYRTKSGLVIQPMDKLSSHGNILRWGILGCGHIAHDFSLALKALPNAEIAAVSARDAKRANKFAERHGARKSYCTYVQLVNDPNVDIIYVATIPDLHRQHAELALKAGKHVLVEKPLATSAEDAEAIQYLAKKYGKFCMEGMWMRFFPAVEFARQLIDKGELGEIRHVRADFGFDLFEDEGKNNTKWAAGAGMNAGVYPTHAAVMMFGTELIKLGAAGITDNLGYNMDAEGFIHATFTENRTAAITWSHLVGTPEETLIVGSKGCIRLHPPAHAPTTITVSRLNKNRRSRQNPSFYTHEFPLPVVKGKLCYPNSEGLYYEAAAVQRCILSGMTECPQAPLSESVFVIKLIQHSIRCIFEDRQKISLNQLYYRFGS